MPPPRTLSNSRNPVRTRAVFDPSILSSEIGALEPRKEEGFLFAVTANGRSSNEFHASHCEQRPSHRGDSNPHALQKKTERALATGTA